MKVIALSIIVTSIVILVFFYTGVVNTFFYALVGLLIVLIISFLFTTVAATAIAIVGTNPVSGMTLMTLLFLLLFLFRSALGELGNDCGIINRRSCLYALFQCRVHLSLI